MKCSNCGAGINRQMVQCPYCSSYLPGEAASTKSETPPPEQPVVQHVHHYYHQPEMVDYHSYRSDKKRWVAFFLCLFFGAWGVHKFYLGRFAIGVFYFFTLGVFGIGWVIDLIVLLAGGARDRQGRLLS